MRRAATGTEMAMATFAFQLRPPPPFSSGLGRVVDPTSVVEGGEGVVREKTWEGLSGREPVGGGCE